MKHTMDSKMRKAVPASRIPGVDPQTGYLPGVASTEGRAHIVRDRRRGNSTCKVAAHQAATRGHNYQEHGHHLNSAFGRTKSPKNPAPSTRDLAPQIVDIDIEHFLAWFETASRGERI